VRSIAPKPVGQGIQLGGRPTAFPSFSKGKPSMEYARSLDSHVIIETQRPMAASTLGRHGRGTTMFPVDEAGNYLKSFPAKEATLYEPHWLMGYKKVAMMQKKGGLIRSKDYKSEDKPYPMVDEKDFAGKNRTYPIPTKADARDALKLAGLHGRKDIRSKVLQKYPELNKYPKL